MEYHYLFSRKETKSFYVKKVDTYEDKISRNRLYTGYLRLDDAKSSTKPEIYSMKDLLTEIGGLGQTLFVILELTNMFLGRQLILRKIIGDLYLMKKQPQISEIERAETHEMRRKNSNNSDKKKGTDEAKDILDFLDTTKSKQATFTDKTEQKHYKSLSEAISNEKVKESQIKQILCHMLINRQRLANVFTVKVYFYSIVISLFPCCCNKKDPEVVKKVRKAKIYEHAVKRYFKEMDVLNIVRTNRMMRLLMGI